MVEIPDVERGDLNQRAAEMIQEAARICAETKVKIRNVQAELERRRVKRTELVTLRGRDGTISRGRRSNA